MNIADRLEPVLLEIESSIKLHEDVNIEYSDKAFRAAVSIFSDVLLNRMIDLQDGEGMSQEDSEAMSQVAGEEIRRIVKTFTGIDTHDLYKKA